MAQRKPTPDIMGDVLAAPTDRQLIRAQLRYDYSALAATDRAIVQSAAVDIVEYRKRAQDGLLLIGERLIEIKGRLEHGQFEDWCAVEFAFSQRTVQHFMNVFREFGDPEKRNSISFLNDTVLGLLAAPSTPEPARIEVIEQAQATGKGPTVADAKAAIARHKPQPKPSPEQRQHNSEVPAMPPPPPAGWYAKDGAAMAGELRSIIQRTLNVLPDVLDLAPEAEGAVVVAERVLKDVLRHIDAAGGWA